MAAEFFNHGKKVIFDHSDTDAVDLLADNIRVGLMEQGVYSPDIDSHTYWGDSGVSSDEITATGYDANGDGRNLASKTMTQDNTNDRVEFDAADLTYDAIGGAANDTFDRILLFKWTGVAGTSPVVAYADVTATTTNGGDVTLTWDAEGILQMS
jgi:hypothetical protein